MTTISTYNSLVTTLNTQGHNPVPDGLDGLDNFQTTNAERRVNAGGSEPRQRARVYASILGVNAEKLAAYVGSLLRRVPAENRWHHQEDLEQAIWALLYQRREYCQGSWELVKLVTSDAYATWYSAYANERQLGVEAINRSISLERAYASAEQGDSEPIGHDVPDGSWIAWETAVESNVDGYKAMVALPEHIQALVERKANGTPITRAERTRLQRFLAGGPTKKVPATLTNKQVLARVLAGTHIGPITWSKPQR